ncbi:hypothetical protein [Nostoc sp. ChiQUE01b]|uniref:hypothetical protein n=1 Tax=Nostoc sp. ChiQUE01b TaxID=3075376 RepID=UPI002AD55DE9|nr:hypothetical protein [Nostoc sp. ChiQUE01b]MDZ8260635.1 hypothetical protein [Nostoc sp. ChiQUE01b]
MGLNNWQGGSRASQRTSTSSALGRIQALTSFVVSGTGIIEPDFVSKSDRLRHRAISGTDDHLSI